MEFLSGYAAARAPLSAYQVEPHHPQSQRPSSARPTRSNSTSGTTKKRSRIHGHIRTSSASTSSSSRTEVPPSSPHPGTPWVPVFESGGPGNDSTTALALAPAPVPAGSASAADQYTPRRDLQQRERMPAASRYYQNKQLPATPRLDTNDVASRFLTTGSASEPNSARTPASAGATTTFSNTTNIPPPSAPASTATFQERRALQHAAMFPDPGAGSKVSGSSAFSAGTAGFSRAESVSSISGATTVSSRTAPPSDPASNADLAAQQLKPFVVRNGRTYISDLTLPYPLPVDLEELHRQSLRTLLLMQLFGGPICSPAFAEKPPTRVLEVGCGSGFWSMMCYRYYERQGQHSGISFTGIDIAPIAPGASGAGTTTSAGAGNRVSSSSAAGAAAADGRPDRDMKWRFVQHDMRRFPWPFQNEEFDLVMVKDMSMAMTSGMQQSLMDEYLRILAPGGTLECWESDHTLRMLRPHVPEPPISSGAATDNDSDASDDEDDEKEEAHLGAYLMTANTPLSSPTNNFLIEYNSWVSRALELRSLSPVPCTIVGPMLLQEAEVLTGMGNLRLAIPLSEIRWEREGVGGVVTKNGKSYIETKGLKAGQDGAPTGKALDPAAAALRRTALLTVVQMIQNLEHVLREVSGKSQDEWDGWLGKMMNDLVKGNGTSWGECLEVGAWWARKRLPAV
ncbi:hypothetical protein B0H63DRAFT_306773 [Podospora didyma]|uniref:Methyltransferase type 11 domain-containing protein n=1 Tax=Podospora didyma TaxID=330526 RepID=A0AAE0N444_9PEZI|nr:hypothetical protein B0H63DRAFT_306773 [Podospora didyma]